MKSDAARFVRKGQVLVEPEQVGLIVDIKSSDRLRTVEFDLEDKLTLERYSRTFAWLEQITVDDPMEVDAASGLEFYGSRSVQLAKLVPHPPLYRCVVTNKSGSVLFDGSDLVTTRAGTTTAMTVLVHALQTAALGVGWAVSGRVSEVCAEKGWTEVQVNAVKVSELDSEPEKYKNIRSALWCRARKACHDQLWDLGAIDDKCINELTTPKWSENSSRQIEVEKREKIVKRLGHSPDSASSLILAPHRPKRQAVGITEVQDLRLRSRR